MDGLAAFCTLEALTNLASQVLPREILVHVILTLIPRLRAQLTFPCSFRLSNGETFSYVGSSQERRT